MSINQFDSRCQNCGQPALSDDRICFHCGRPLPGREAAEEQTARASQGWQHGISRKKVGLFLVMTVGLIIAALTMMTILGQQPLVQIGFNTREPDNWQDIVVHDRAFIIFLPPAWEWYDASESTSSSTLGGLPVVDGGHASSLRPLLDFVKDIEVRFVAVEGKGFEDGGGAFVVLGRSKILKEVTTNQALEILNENEYVVGEATMVENFDKSYLGYSVELPTYNNNRQKLFCNQQLIHGDTAGYVLAVCSPSPRIQGLETTFTEIYESFQLLDG